MFHKGMFCWVWYAVLAACLGTARAGYLTVNMDDPVQCGNANVSWYGDTGPYHLLLTPTTFVSHGYNQWIATIPNGTNSYTLPINQPAGLQFMLTVWGNGGIEYAGTTTVLTVGSSPTGDSSCFLSDSAINSLYTFAFNITNPNSLPPQCSNMSITWPTSLESAITDTRRSVPGDDETEEVSINLNLARDVAAVDSTNVLDDMSSSNKSSGNTTVPPTIFGIIPLGNSFSLPITYSKTSKFADGLPASSLSDTPTTWTSQGITHMNWTINLAKGTRFILVAGIGSLEEWASGGSSEMMTVGQGDSACLSSSGAVPSVTADSTSGSVGPTDDSSTSTPKRSTSSIGIILACVFSALGTFLMCMVLWWCCRIRKHRQRAVKAGLTKPSIVNLATFGKMDRKRGPNRNIARYSPGHGHGADTQLDLIGNEHDSIDGGTPPPGTAGSRRLPNITTSPTPRPISAVSGMEYPSPSSSADFREVTPYIHAAQASNVSMRSATMYEEPPYSYQYATSPLSSPVLRNMSFDRVSDLRNSGADFIGRQASIDGLVSYPPLAHTPAESTTGIARRGPLVLHDPTGADHDSDEEEANPVNVAEFKRETLAHLGSAPSSPTIGASGQPVPPPRRRRSQPAEYVVHRDAGRVAGTGPSSRRVFELPPRYEELMWDDEDESPAGTVAPGTRTGTPSATGGSTPLTPGPPVSLHGVSGPQGSAPPSPLALRSRPTSVPTSPVTAMPSQEDRDTTGR